MSCDCGQGCTCGCCGGISVQTPQGEQNAAGLSAIAYRTGTWATFKESMLARLSSSEYPALAGLKTRDDEDYSIALLDASAVMLDILTFYQERLANESYLRTAMQLDSLTQLSRLIGYQPSPGVSASTYLAFTLSSAPGSPINPNTTAITIPVGTTVQSVPGQGQMPQLFETSAAILAKPDWNALPVQTGVPWVPADGQTSVYLAGISTMLNPGDAVLIVGDERLNSVVSQQWDVRIVSSVQPDAVNQRTLVSWLEPLGNGSIKTAKKHPKLYALRQKATLFGYNAINPSLLSSDALSNLGSMVTSTKPYEWVFGKDSLTGGMFASESLVDLDSVYTKVVPGGWMALIVQDGNLSRTPAGKVLLFSVASASTTARSNYGLSAKVTRVQVSAGITAAEQAGVLNELTRVYKHVRATAVLAQSEELTLAEQPLARGLYGTCLDLEGVRQDLLGVTAIAVVGKSQKMTLNVGVTNLTFIPDDGTAKLPVKPGDTLTLLQPPDLLDKTGEVPSWQDSVALLKLTVADLSGRSGTVQALLSDFTLITAASSDQVAQEFALVSSVQLIPNPFAHTRIVLRSPLINCYDRTTTSVNANVGPANGGASVTELLGSGSGSLSKPDIYAEADTANLHCGGNSKWKCELTTGNGEWSAVECGAVAVPAGTRRAGIHDAEHAGRDDGGAVRRWRGGIDGTYRAEQHHRELSCGYWCGGQCWGGNDQHACRQASWRKWRDEPDGSDWWAGRAVG